jgi:hypothetical protein
VHVAPVCKNHRRHRVCRNRSSCSRHAVVVRKYGTAVVVCKYRTAVDLLQHEGIGRRSRNQSEIAVVADARLDDWRWRALKESGIDLRRKSGRRAAVQSAANGSSWRSWRYHRRYYSTVGYGQSISSKSDIRLRYGIMICHRTGPEVGVGGVAIGGEGPLAAT